MSYNPATKILTLTTTTPESFETITALISASKLILREFRVDLNIGDGAVAGAGVTVINKTSFYRSLGLEIGTVVGKHFVIDDTPNACFFQIGLSHNHVWTHPAVPEVVAAPGVPAVPEVLAYQCESTVGNPNTPLTMSGELSKSFYWRIYDDTGRLLPAAELKYLRVQFEVVDM